MGNALAMISKAKVFSAPTMFYKAYGMRPIILMVPVI